jgi:hypothetical protein
MSEGNAWIAKLKVGDIVLRADRFGGSMLVKVIKILPSGRIRFDSRDLMDKYGRHRCSERFCGVQFREWNDAEKYGASVSKARRFLEKFAWPNLDEKIALELYERLKAERNIK